MVGQASIEVKFEDMSLEGMQFKINSPYYHHVNSTIEFRARHAYKDAIGDPNSIISCHKSRFDTMYWSRPRPLCIASIIYSCMIY